MTFLHARSATRSSVIMWHMENKIHAKKIPYIIIQGVGASDTCSTHYVDDISLRSLHEPSGNKVKVRCYVFDSILPVSEFQDL